MVILHIDRHIQRKVVIVISSLILLFVADALDLRRKLFLHFMCLWVGLWVSRSFCCDFIYVLLPVSTVCVSFFLK
jgi:hypothetical protein